MDELKSYADRRLELGDMIRAALYLAREAGDERAEQRARDLVARLAADRFRLAVVGQFSRGKSTLMNALLGGAYLPMGAAPMTSVITTVRYGSRPRAIVRRRAAGLATEVPLPQVAGYVAQASATRSELQVMSVEVEIPAEILRLGFEFIDTPGVGSAIEINTATTRRFLPQADAVVFVTGFDSPLTGGEVEFLADAARHAGQLVVVVNKRDLVTAADAAGAAEFIREQLRELGLGGQGLFGLSALEALEAVTGGNSERLAGSGVPELHAGLREFLATGKTRVFLGNIAARAARLVAGQRRDLLLGRLARDGGPDPERVLATFDAGMAELDRQRCAVVGAIAARIQARLPGLLAARSPEWQASLLELLGPRAADAPPGGAVRDVLEDARASLERAGRDVAGSWLERRTGEVLEMITGAVGGEIGALLDLARSPGAAGAKIAGLPSEDDRRDLAGWSAEDIPGLAARQPAWTVQVELPRRPRRRAGPDDPEVRDRLAAALSAAAAAYTGRVRTAFQQAAQDWAEQLGEQAAQQMGQAADWFRQCLRTVPAEADLAALDSLIARLAAFQAGLGTAGEDDASAGIVTAAPSPETAAEDCAVCRQMEQTLTGHLYSGQFRLATREDEQERHTLAGGFCPLHTWQYAAVASPLGISAGYAGLAASVADALDRLSGPGFAAADLARDVAALTAAPGTCPVCTALAGRERTAIAELIAQVPAAPVAVCLRHLALALSAGANAQTGQALLRGLAARLRRDSEDMRAYALKREAYRSGLVTTEESRAHADALRRLAGLPALTKPWANQDPAGQ